LLNEGYSKDVCDLFTKGKHHSNINVILITQNLFHQGRYCRGISQNAKYIVGFKKVRDKNQFYPARQVYPEDIDGLFQAYLFKENFQIFGLLPDGQTRAAEPSNLVSQGVDHGGPSAV
jgi:hypothetical protein